MLGRIFHQLTEKDLDLRQFPPFGKSHGKSIDQVYQAVMLMVYGFDADFETLIPIKELHEKKPVSRFGRIKRN